ncbi:hypothetical protein [Bradyrhizobium sp. 150]|uniref:hypothetical protein n=1 Tax=Bradyrhizobium sp. 150 TaxID=2782625 RepID=UPI001FF9500B|nr:hypothetical protein [Bradyrhizobium sp. 150]MCK1670320.1 hypothetical protein [Bradyrhizobium sp. 150]
MFNSIKNWFWHSETILFARLQVAFGIIWVVLSETDLSPVLSGHYLTYWLIISGIITEILRRRNTQPGSMVIAPPAPGTVEPVKAAYLMSPPPGP